MRTCPAVKAISFNTNVPRHTYHPPDDRHTALETRQADRPDKSRGPSTSQTRHLDPRESMTLVPQQQLPGGFTFQPLLILVASRRDCYNFIPANSGFAIHAVNTNGTTCTAGPAGIKNCAQFQSHQKLLWYNTSSKGKNENM